MSTFLEYALDYAKRGWHLFPCIPVDKAPYIPADLDGDGNKIPKTGGLYKATRDTDVIKEWWTRWPHAMIGVRMGEASGVWALDPDAPDKPGKPDGRANWAVLQLKNGNCPPTHTHLTPGGGKHLLFKWRADRPITNSEGQLKGLGVNVRGNGGYVIAPPSRRDDGKAYEIEEPLDFFSFAEAPDWLYQLILPKPEVRPSISQRALATVRQPSLTAAFACRKIEGIVRAIATAGEGDRNKLLYWGACRLAELENQSIISRADATGLAVEAALHAGLSRIEASRTVQTAFRGRQ